MTGVILATVVSYILGWLIGLPWLLPFLNAAWPWWTMARELRAGRTGRAIAVCALGFPIYAAIQFTSLLLLGPWPV